MTKVMIAFTFVFLSPWGHAQTVTNGLIRYNSSLNKFQGYQNNAWYDLINPSGPDNLGNHTATQQILSTLGTASAPGYSFSGDTNTGFWDVGVSELAFSTSGTERMRILSSGYVTMGTTTAGTLMNIATPPRFTLGLVTSAHQTALVRGANAGTTTNNPSDYSASLFVQNTNNTAGTFSNLGFYSSGGYVTSKIIGVHVSHSTNAGDLVFLPTPPAASPVELVRITSSKRVGIGSTSPSTGLDVAGTANLSAVVLPGDDFFDRPTGINGMVRYNTTAHTIEGFQNDQWLSFNTGAGLEWSTSGTDIVRNSGGSVGINTSAPVREFEVVGQVYFTSHINGDSTNNSMDLAMRSSQGTQGTPTQTTNGDYLGFIGGRGYVNGSGFASSASAAIGFAAAENFTSATNVAGRIEFYTRPTGAGSRLERLRIDHNGYFIMGTGGAVASVGALLDVNGTGQAYSSLRVPRDTTANRPAVGLNGMIRYNTNNSKMEVFENGAWRNITTASDARLKKNIVEMVNGVELAEKMNPVYFDWDFSNPHALGYQDRHQVGFIAQDLEAILPEVVDVGADTYRSVEYGKIVTVAIAGLKDLSARQRASLKTCQIDTSLSDKLKHRLAVNEAALGGLEKRAVILKMGQKSLRQMHRELSSRLSRLENH